jgi:hypothetical protein
MAQPHLFKTHAGSPPPGVPGKVVPGLHQTDRRRSHPARLSRAGADHYEAPEMTLTRQAYPKYEEGPVAVLQQPGHKPGNDLLSRDLTSYYHWLRGA